MMADRLQKEKDRKLALILDYDKSQGVNSFLLNGQPVWLDKATRVGLVNSLTMEKGAGRESTILWLDGRSYDIPIDTAFNMLYQLELYAKDCYNTTEQHKANILAEKDLNRVYNYDYTKGYPKRLVFEHNVYGNKNK
jgi:hypothetical protein